VTLRLKKARQQKRYSWKNHAYYDDTAKQSKILKRQQLSKTWSLIEQFKAQKQLANNKFHRAQNRIGNAPALQD